MYIETSVSLHQAAKETIGIQGNKISNKIWWNKEIEVMIKHKKQIFKVAQYKGGKGLSSIQRG